MTIDAAAYPSESLILPSKCRFLPIQIPTPHHQLRHLISTADKDWIYYVASHDVYCLHLPTQRKHILVTLPFSGRCISAGLGWIAVGGDSRGECAFIKITWRSENPQTEVDASLPLDLQNAQQQASDQNSDAVVEPWPEVILQELGKDIVNSVMIHDLASKDRSKISEPVVVLCNNDKTLKIYSLLRQEVIADLTHPFSMNYGIISPDSEHLVAVGDDAHIYFYRRKVGSGKHAYYNDRPLENHEWELVAVPDHSDATLHPGINHFFSIAFSSSGHLCAVASQPGVIAIYDMTVMASITLEDEPKQACYCSFKSSRPYHEGGAVRSMAFSPAPWDLLAWVEEHGRVGVADIRQAFWRRQQINLEPGGSNVEKLSVEDVTDEFIRGMDTEARLSYQYGVTSNLNDAADADSAGLSDATAHRRRLRREARAARTRSLRWQISGLEDLTDRERQVLASLGSRYPHEEAESLLSARSGQPYSINYTSSPRVRSFITDEDNHVPSSRSDMLRRIMRNMENALPGSSHSTNDSAERPFQPRRRSSVVLSHANTSHQSSTTLAPFTDSSMRLSASPSRLPPTTQNTNNGASSWSGNTTSSRDITRPSDRNDPDDAWDLIQSALEASRRSSPGDESSQEVPAQLSRLLAAQRQRQSSPGSSSNTARTSTLPTTSTAMTRQSSAPRDLSSELPPPRIPTPGDLQLTLTDNDRQRRSLAPPRDPDSTQASTLAPRYHPSTLDFLRQRAQRASTSSSSRPRSASGAGAGVSGSSTGASSGEVYSTMRLARIMMQRSGEASTDANGNWIAGEALQRVLRGSVNEEPGFLDEGVFGVGTAGVGWSRDGRLLYVGTKMGIFELTTDIRDRMMYSGIVFR